MKKYYLALLLLGLLLMAAPASAAEVTDSGSCGDAVTYTLYDTGELVISGTGEMTEYRNYGAPWDNERTSIQIVIIESGVTSVASYAFSDCTNLTGITIPSTVTSIGNFVFDDCDGLTSITIPASVTSIGNHAFQNCDGLTSITIPASVTNIGDLAFNVCRGLTGIWVDENNTQYCNDEKGVLYDKTKTKLIQAPAKLAGTYRIPDSVMSIEDHSFIYCKELTSVNISDNVTNIGNSAFSYCGRLTSVTIPTGVTSIGKFAFESSGLVNIAIPDSVTSIGNSAFNGCSQLKNVYFGGDEESWNKIISASQGNSNLTGNTIHYNSDGPYFAEAADDTWTELLGATTVTVRDEACSIATQLHDVDGACSLVAVLSGDTGVLGVSVVDVKANQTNASTTLNARGIKTVTLLVWDRFTGMKPLCRSKKIAVSAQ